MLGSALIFIMAGHVSIIVKVNNYDLSQNVAFPKKQFTTFITDVFLEKRGGRGEFRPKRSMLGGC